MQEERQQQDDQALAPQCAIEVASAAEDDEVRGGEGYVQHRDHFIVLYGLPSVSAAAAKGESATGGETSESTA